MFRIPIIALLALQLIPVEYESRSKLYSYLIPADSILWWQAGMCNLDSKKFHIIFFCSDSTKEIQLPEFKEHNTFASNYFHSFLNRDYLIYTTKSGKTNLIKKVENLPSFIGEVDNLGEALFLASIYGYWWENGMKYGSYSIENGCIILNMYKINNPPDVIPIIHISEPGSFEFSFHKIGIPIFYLDFNQVKENEPESVWLTTTLNYRGIGSEATDKQFFPTRLSERYNAIIFIDSTHASHCFSIY